AGAAGMAAAKRLQDFGLDVLVLEASSRTGGRAHTDDVLGVRFDRGAHWLHSGDMNPLAALARERGITYHKGRRVSCLRFANRWATGREVLAWVRYCERAMDEVAQVGEAGTDVSVASVLPGDPHWRPLLSAWMADMSGVEAEDASTIDFARYRDTRKDWPVREGLGTLVGLLGQGIRIRRAAPVKRIEWSGPCVRVVSDAGTTCARAVLVTVSTAVLASGSIRFEPALPAWKRSAIEAIPLGLLNKVFIRIEHPGLGIKAGRHAVYVPSAPRTMAMSVKPFGLPLVVAHAGGRHADELEQLGAEAMREEALETLRSLLGGDALRAVVGVTCTSWRSDPLARGAYSASLPGSGDQRAVLAQPLEHRLFFAGEACSSKHFSTVHGAYLSGCAVAERIARRL
ncbi:MAG: flavin monoamine oxidase family protein, partial [Myxococcota bacterium]